MTSTTDTDEHPEVSEISALAEGALRPDRMRAVREHLAECPLCADVHTSLEEIRGLLGTLPGPARMPNDIAGRIDAALAAEALLDATADRHGDVGASAGAKIDTHAGTETGAVSRETTLEPADVSRETAPSGPDRPPGRARSTTGPGRQAPGVRATRGRRWRTALLSTACAAAVLGVGTFLVQNGPDEGSSTQNSTTEGGSGATTLSSRSLERQVRALLTETDESAHKALPSQGAGVHTSPNSPMSDGGDAIPSCVKEGTKRPETPLAAKRNTYDGKPAYLVVLPHPGDDTTVDAFVVSADCVRQSPSPPGTVLMQRNYSRG
ncbi:anti-sigma factor family protein [Streptomyces zagrosensis]|uniref:Anti-sigma factor RsiW n=1 Tax=Streptomyces zagrosensis TaxID=1042984 RepID=A0A7W9Q5P8_9ACTN|nr:zf-HC2 domain-containing protein [Streptomyces zagrosensis]MBB5934114.1 anti-sigma factor RsiW [Streptomyces zagrosensis]